MDPSLFDYDLPQERIAQFPSARRSEARMLVLGEPIVHACVGDLAVHLPKDVLLVLNDTRVVPSRLFLERSDGRAFELLVVSPTSCVRVGGGFTAWVRRGKALRVGDRLHRGDLRLRFVGRVEGDPRGFSFELEEGQLEQALETHGQLALPPYIEREAGPTDTDQTRYQTIYARAPGSIAAPTAGLHFEPELLAKFETAFVTLHVGTGTFLPIDTRDARDHRVGAESFEVPEASAIAIEAARRSGREIVAVGTTVVRTLETVAQVHAGRVVPMAGTTELVVSPGYPFAVVDRLITNFHLPRSSLLMLTCAFGGRTRVLEAYREAVRQGYRFYSFGDCMLLQRAPLNEVST